MRRRGFSSVILSKSQKRMLVNPVIAVIQCKVLGLLLFHFLKIFWKTSINLREGFIKWLVVSDLILLLKILTLSKDKQTNYYLFGMAEITSYGLGVTSHIWLRAGMLHQSTILLKLKVAERHKCLIKSKPSHSSNRYTKLSFHIFLSWSFLTDCQPAGKITWILRGIHGDGGCLVEGNPLRNFGLQAKQGSKRKLRGNFCMDSSGISQWEVAQGVGGSSVG